ncbi:MAG: FAD-dependent oxidoreductase [Clostridia bacterium]
MTELTRRGFLVGAGAAAATLAMTAAAGQPAYAAEKKATKNEDWASQITEEISCDILVVGGGFSGTAAAVQAGENGDKVLLIEGQSALGGNGTGVECTNAYGLHPNSGQATLGDMVRYEADAQSYTVNQMFIHDMIGHAAENVQWLIDNGVQYEAIEDLDPAYLAMYKEGRYRAEFSFDYVYKGGAAGIGYFPFMKKKLSEYGVNLRLNTRARDLILDEGGNVVGVYATDTYGDTIKINTKAVIVGTGGFGEDADRMGKLGIDLDDVRIIGTPGHYGDGVTMMVNAGGVEHGAPAFGCTNIIGSAGAWGPIWEKLCWGGPCLWVDINGERFSDEACSTYTHNFELQHVPVRLAGGTCWTVMDQSVLDTMLDGDNEAATLWSEMVEQGDDAYKADTLEKLADSMGVDKKLFLSQVEQYNACVKQGVDVDYGKDAAYLMPLTTPPFYCGLIRGALEGLYSGGVKTDRQFRVKKPGRDQAFENLFAIGADGGMLYNNMYGIDINGSMSCHGLNSARAAANTAHAYLTGK